MVDVERTVRFYAAFNGENGGRVTSIDWPGIQESLAKGTEQENQVITGPGSLMVGKPLAADGLTLLNVSQVDLPKLYNSETGELRDLDEVLGDDEVLDVAEITYFRGYPNGILGFLYNHRGPKPKQLGTYINRVFDPGLDLGFRPIPRTGVVEAVEEAGEVRVFRIKLPRTGAGTLEGTPLSGMKDLADSMGGSDIEVIIRARGPARSELARRTGPLARLLKDRRGISKLQVELGEGEDIQGERALDLLEEYLVVEATVPADAGRSYIREDDALAVIDQAYAVVRGLLAGGLAEM